MKKLIAALCLGLCWFCLNFAQAKGTCDLSRVPNIDGLHLGMTVDEFLALHPTAEYDNQFGGNRNPRKGGLDFPWHDGRSTGELANIGGIGHIATLDKVVYSFAISFLDAGASYETPLKNFRDMLVARYHLPSNGWKQVGAHRSLLRCGDMELEVHQDFGAQHTAIGPVLFARNLRLAKIAERLK